MNSQLRAPPKTVEDLIKALNDLTERVKQLEQIEKTDNLKILAQKKRFNEKYLKQNVEHLLKYKNEYIG